MLVKMARKMLRKVDDDEWTIIGEDHEHHAHHKDHEDHDDGVNDGLCTLFTLTSVQCVHDCFMISLMGQIFFM